jgi:hypothetical protein
VDEPLANADPLRQHLLDALARRAEASHGAQQRLLQARWEDWQARPWPAPPASAPERSKPAAGPLAGLLQGLRPPELPRDARSAAEPELLQFFRSTWARLDADRRLNHALADKPENAGPLNSEHLVHQALQLMRGCAPDYMRHFMLQVDSLMWLQDALAEAAPPAKPAPKTKPAGKTAAKAAPKGSAKAPVKRRTVAKKTVRTPRT